MPSRTSLVAFFLIVTPVVYVLSYAPVVKVCGRTAEFPVDGRSLGLDIRSMDSVVVPLVIVNQPLADGSLYPLYAPVDWLIDNTLLREPLFFWAGLWSAGDEFEKGRSFRLLDSV